MKYSPKAISAKKEKPMKLWTLEQGSGALSDQMEGIQTQRIVETGSIEISRVKKSPSLVLSRVPLCSEAANLRDTWDLE